jgi:cell wall assembly regulator SMI1
MTNHLAELDRVWRSAHPESYALLKEPLTTSQFDQLANLMKVAPPDDYRAIFEWKGGQSALAERGLLPEWRLMQFEEIRIEYTSMLELYEMGEFSAPDWWRPEWLPLLTNAEGATICYDSLGALGGRRGQLIQFSSDSADRTIWFPTVDALLASAIAGFESPDEVQFPEGYPIGRRASRPTH